MSPEVATLQRMQDIVPASASRMFMLKLPQADVPPAVASAVVTLVDNLEDTHLRGGSKSGVAHVQIDVYAPEASGADPYTNAEALADSLHGDSGGSGLQGFTGVVGGSPGGLLLTGIRFITRAATYDADDRRTVRIRLEYFVHYRNP